MTYRYGVLVAIFAGVLCAAVQAGPVNWLLGPKVIELGDMPVVRPESVRGLVHLEPDPSTWSTLDPNLPGVPTSDSMLEREIGSEFGRLVNGWEVRNGQSLTCSRGQLEARSTYGGVVSIGLRGGLHDGILDFLLTNHCARAYHAVRLNQRFIAFVTAEPGWVFLDLKEKAFVPVVVATTRSGVMRLLADDDGAIYADMPSDERYGSLYGKRRPTLFRLDAPALHLTAPRRGPVCLERGGGGFQRCETPARASD